MTVPSDRRHPHRRRLPSACCVADSIASVPTSTCTAIPSSPIIPRQQRAARLVQLLGHQPWRHLDDVGLQPELTQRVGGLQTQQAATDHHPGGGMAGVDGAQRVGADRVEIVECAVDVAGRKVVSRHRWDERVRAGGQHQCVVVDALTVGGQHRLRVPVDLGDPAPEPQLDRSSPR